MLDLLGFDPNENVDLNDELHRLVLLLYLYYNGSQNSIKMAN